MYQIENSRQALSGLARLKSLAGARPAVSRTVILLGITSLLTDISSEMVSTVLPLYLVLILHLPPLQFGFIDGIYQGGSVLVRLASGLIADRRRDSKTVAVVGYALSALTRPALLVAQGATAFGSLVLVDRIGKGIRTAPRDAMIAASATPSGLATAFGVHRALDTAGAMLGPLLAVLLLGLTPGSFDAVFVVSFCFAILGVAVIGLLVREPTRVAQAEDSEPKVSLRDAMALLNDAQFRRVTAVGALLALLTISDAFVYLALQRQIGLSVGIYPLLFVATALVFMITAVPVGRLADVLGRQRVFVGGYVVLGLSYVTLIASPAAPLLAVLVVTLLGLYYAMTDGVLQAIASSIVGPTNSSNGSRHLGQRDDDRTVGRVDIVWTGMDRT